MAGGTLLSAWAMLACLCAARPQHGEVKLITEPRPGEEFVLFQSGQANQTGRAAFNKQELNRKTVDDFSTSHKIPLRKAILDKKFETMDFDEAHRIPVHEDFSKRSVDEADVGSPSYTQPEVAESVIIPVSKAEVEDVRTEFSVVTSRPRKLAGARTGHPAVNVEPRGDTGVLDAKAEGADERKAILKKLVGTDKTETILLKELADRVLKEEKEELLTSVEVKPVSQVGVTKPNFDVKNGDITVPEMKQESVITSTPAPAKVEVTTTYLPLTSASPQHKPNFEIIPVNVIKTNTKEYVVGKSLDFVDSPLDDKLLVPAGSSANSQSRIEVKKGPNGEDYEYEYVYYYYDDADNDTSSAPAEKIAGSTGDRSNVIHKAAAPATTTTTSTTTTTTTTTTEKPASNKKYLPTGNLVRKDSDSQEDQGSSEKVRIRSRNKNSAVDPPHAEEHAASGKGRGRYTPIERHRGEATTTIIPEAVNEVIPARISSRFRNRQHSTAQPEEPAPVVEERLPANTRFPPRSRSGSAASTTPPPASQERGRSATSSVRRPSLELVDSSSFRTHSSGASPDQDITGQTGYSRSYTPSIDSSEVETRPSRPGRTRGQPTLSPSTLAEEDDDDASLETEAPVRSRGPHIRRPTSTVPPEVPLIEEEEVVVDMQTTKAPPQATHTAEYEAETGPLASTTEDSSLTAAMMDKAALELYAVLQQAQAENASNLVDEYAVDRDTEREEYVTEEFAATATPTTTAPPTTTAATTTTTTTTTTPAPTTTTTTTTTTEAPTTSAGGRGNRYKNRAGNGGGSRNRYKSSPSSTTTTTESAPAESSTRARGRFGGHRTTSSGGFGGRRKPVKHEESHEAEPEAQQESSPSTAKPTFSRNRFGGGRPSRGGTTTSTTEHSTSDASSSASNSAVATKPVFPERHTSRRRPGLRPSFTTAAPTSEETKSDGEDNNEPATSSETAPASTATLRPAPGSRPRISLSPGSARPLRPGPRINIGGRLRPGAPTSTTPLPSSAAEGDVSAEQPSSPATPEDSAPETSEEAVTTPVPDALTRLRIRPKLRVTERAPKSTPTPVSGRRNLVSSLLPRRRPQAQPEPAKEATEAAIEEQGETAEESESIEKEETAPPPAETAPASEPPQEGGRLSSLLAGRRRNNLPRRPGTLFPSSAGRPAPSSKEAA